MKLYATCNARSYPLTPSVKIIMHYSRTTFYIYISLIMLFAVNASPSVVETSMFYSRHFLPRSHAYLFFIVTHLGFKYFYYTILDSLYCRESSQGRIYDMWKIMLLLTTEYRKNETSISHFHIHRKQESFLLVECNDLVIRCYAVLPSLISFVHTYKTCH